MDNYSVKIRPEVLVMLDVIYENICERSIDDSVAEDVIAAIEKSILSLRSFPERGSNVTNGIYANQDYKKLVVKSHLIIYKVLPEQKQVVIVFVKPEKMNI